MIRRPTSPVHQQAVASLKNKGLVVCHITRLLKISLLSTTVITPVQLSLIQTTHAQTTEVSSQSVSPEVRDKERAVLKQWKVGVKNVSTTVSNILQQVLYVVELPDENSPLAERDRKKDKLLDNARSALNQLVRSTKPAMVPPPFPTQSYLQTAQQAAQVIHNIFKQSKEMLLDINNFYVAATHRGMNATEEQLPLRLRLEAMLQDLKNVQLDFLVLLQEPETLEFRLSNVFAYYAETAAKLLHAASDILYSEAPFARRAEEVRNRGYDAFIDSSVTLDLAQENLQMLRETLALGQTTLLQRENLKNRDKHSLKRLYRLYQESIDTLAKIEGSTENIQSAIDSRNHNVINLHLMTFMTLLEETATQMADLDKQRFEELDRLSPSVYPEPPRPEEKIVPEETDKNDQNMIFGNGGDRNTFSMPSIENIRDKNFNSSK